MFEISAMLQWFSLPSTEDATQYYRMVMIRGAVYFNLAACLSLLIFGIVEPPTSVVVFYVIVVTMLSAQLLVWHSVRRYRISLASILLIAPIWLALAYGVYVTGGINSTLIMIYMVPVIMSGVLLGIRPLLATITLTFALFGLLALIEYFGYLPTVRTRSLVFHVFMICFTFGVTTALLVYHLINARAAEQRNLSLQVDAERMSIYRQMTQDIAHDLRTPLTVLTTKTYLIRKQHERGRDIDANLGLLEDYAAKMRDMMEAFFQLTELDSQAQSTTQQAAFNLIPLLHEVLQDHREYAAERNITLEAKFREGCDLQLEGNRAQIQRVFQNLVTNAIHYGSEGGRVAVSLELHQTQVAVSIADDGIGIAPEHHQKIFERFFRVNEARTMNKHTGGGLGLAIVDHIVRLHGGTIQLESALGEGSLFTVTLPRASAQAVPESPGNPTRQLSSR